MKCLSEQNNGPDLLIAYLEGTLDTETRHALDRHAASCVDCRELLSVSVKLDTFTVPVLSSQAAAAFDAGVLARIAEHNVSVRTAAQSPSPWWSALLDGFLSRPMIPVGVAATAVVAALLVLPLDRSGTIANPAENPGAKMATANPVEPILDQDLEQLEQLMEDLELLMPLEDAGSSL